MQIYGGITLEMRNLYDYYNLIYGTYSSILKCSILILPDVEVGFIIHYSISRVEYCLLNRM